MTKDERFYDPMNKKEIAKMKNQIKEIPIDEFVGLKSKMYSLELLNNKEIQKAKGIIKNIVYNIRL